MGDPANQDNWTPLETELAADLTLPLESALDDLLEDARATAQGSAQYEATSEAPSSSGWEIPSAPDLFEELPQSVKTEFRRLGLTVDNPQVLRTFLEDFGMDDVADLLEETERTPEQVEEAHLRLQGISALLGDGSMQRRAKRRKSQDYFRTPQVLATRPGPSVSLDLLPRPKSRPLPTMAKIASRAKSRLATAREEEDATARADREEKERIRLALILLKYFTESEVPAYQAAQASLDPARALMGAFGAARPNTLRKHERAWRRVRFWVKVNYGCYWPTVATQLVDFLWSLYEGSCKRTVPQTTLDAVAFMEAKADIPDNDRISAQNLVTSCVKHLTTLLAKGAPPVRKAPMLLIALLAALEFYVMDDEKPAYSRAMAWYILLLVWTAMRFDDTAGLLPEKLKLFDRGLEGLIVRSKSSGPGRKVTELRIFVSIDATVTGKPWLVTGFKIWSTDELFAFRRDYFLPMPNRELTGCVHSEAKYTDATAMARAVLSDAPAVIHYQAEWRIAEGTLLDSAEAASFWRLHGYRNFLKSAALAAGEGSDRTTYLGRWKAEASDEYTRTSRQIIIEIQNSVASKAATTPDFLDESDTLSELEAALLEAGRPEDHVQQQIAKLKTPARGYREETPFNIFERQPIEDAPPEQAEDEQAEDEADNMAPLIATLTEDEADDTAIMEDYWVSQDKRGGKLHITGGCPSFPGQNVKNYEWAATPSEVKWTTLCKKCWKGVPEPDAQRTEDGDRADESSSGSSSSSSSEGGDGI